MKLKYYCVLILFLLCGVMAKAQDKPAMVDDTVKLTETIVQALRSHTPLGEIPAAISVIKERQLTHLNKSISAEEIFRLVPGVRIDNGTGGSRVHVYMRGMGVLSETGFRGVQVLIDGIPVNDPGGYCPDLYDVDWSIVKKVEVVKGLASLYGGSANGGVINITTEDGGDRPVGGSIYAIAGSYGFFKTMATVNGTEGKVDYRISYSHTQGNGYRIHQAFMGDNFSEKLNWKPTDKIKITQLLSYTKYFNQNSEGINLGRYDTVGPQAANTDAIPFNEFHLTKRLTGGTVGTFDLGKNQNLMVKGFFRFNSYRETSNNGDDNKPFMNMGFSAQYNLHSGQGKVRNHLSIGADYQDQTMNETMFGVTNDLTREDTPFGQSCLDLDTLLVNQIIKQRGAGFFLIDKLDLFKKVYLTLNLRYDYVYNELVNNIPLPDSVVPSSGRRDFGKPTFRFGIAYDICKYANLYAGVGTGFLIPTEDELYNNPEHWGGFNMLIDPSTTQSGELGIRGDVGKKFHYDVTVFDIMAKNEFFRYSIPERGNNMAFFGNIGESNRFGVETALSYSPIKNLFFDVAYTYTDCKYTAPDSVSGHRIPQCPQHMATVEASYTFWKDRLTVSLYDQYQSKWCIQVEDSVYDHFNENGMIRSSWVDGFNILSASLAYNWKLGPVQGELSFFVKNLLDEHYFGFTEPNNGPDYNSFQPAAGREFFGSLKVKI